ncbi:MAG: family 78 glycoside hydrolase catalytic domain [Sedimentisphaerales bacterium]|nr:family 78 glycoside hydrolase catalytic domain [Sedimentisphaerales bacterium]
MRASHWNRPVQRMLCVAVLLALCVGVASGQGSVTVAGMRCEYLSDPLGIDVRQPRLNWKLTAVDPKARGQRQTGYQVLVASRKTLLDSDTGDLWDSGMISSDQSVHVVYDGKPLGSGMECYWKVRVKDEDGVTSAWSRPGRWTMGLLQKSDWSARWIGTAELFKREGGWPPPDNKVPDPWLRRTFDLKEKPVRATIHVASVGYHELYVNGHRIGDSVLAPAVANHRKRARYVTYEIADGLQEGRNVIALWLGVSWSIFPPYKTEDRPQTPIVLAQADIKLPGGDDVRIVTDDTWRTHASPNTLLGVWDFMHFGGERYDAGEEIADWAGVDFDDSEWKPATVYSPDLALSAEMIEPNRRIKEIRPVAVEEVKPGVYRVDLGVNVTGWLEASVRGQAGDRIEFKFSERPSQEMTHRLHSQYIIGPSGKGTFRNRFNYFTGRWVIVEGLKYKPALEDMRAWLVRTDYARAADFECSNELLNRVYDTTLRTFEDLSLGGYVVDCPHRERMGYGGDAHATTECGLNNYGLGAFYTKWSQDWRDVQGGSAAWGTAEKAAVKDTIESGNLPYTAPTYWGGGGPGWSGYCITLPWEIYERYGDIRILEDNFPTIQRWLAFLETKAKDSILRRWGGEWDFLGDWLWPGAKGVNGDTRETLFYNNCYWIYNLQTAAKIADVIDRKADADKYCARADEVRKTVHREFFIPSVNSYVNGFQAYLAIALLVDLPPDDVRPAIEKRLEEEILIRRKGHIHAGITGGAFLYKTLLALDRQDLLFAMANKVTYPGWGDMLRSGATTMYESWDMDNSLCHSSYLYIGTWFIEGLAGIKADPQAPGFKHFILKPGIVDGPSLTWVEAHHDSVYGRIVSNWNIDNGGTLTLSVMVPPNTAATLCLPAADEQTVTEGGQPLGKAEGVGPVTAQPGRLLLELQSGAYEFRSSLVTARRL